MLKNLPKLSLVLLGLLVSAFADTIALKGGEKIEGKVIAETDTELTIEVKAGGVVEERVVKKSDVLNVAKEAADETAWAGLKNLKLGDNSLPADRYDAFLSPLKAFIAAHPQSKYKADAEKIAADFSAEQKRVADGERKLSGKWLTKEEVQRESYQINGAIAYNYLREQAARNDVSGALNTFATIEEQYPKSRGYLDAVDFVRTLLPRVKAQADARLAAIPGEIAEQKKGLDFASGAKRVEYQAELDRVKKADEAAIEAAKRQNTKWPPFVARHEPTMKEISIKTGDEAKRLATVDTAKPRRAIALVDQARTALAKKEVEAAEAALKQAKDAWSDYEALARLEKEIEDTRTAVATAKAAAPAATPVPKAEDKKAEGKTADTPTAPVVAKDEDEPANPFFRIVIALVIAAIAFAGWKAYSGIRKKANEVIE